MLDSLDIVPKIKKSVYRQVLPGVHNRFYSLQQAAWEARIPVVVVFEGWDAAGKGSVIQNLTAPMDPRGFRVYPIGAENAAEKKYPWMRRFWLRLPERGEWSIFDRSWYWRVLDDRINKTLLEKEWRKAYRDILDFERILTDDGYLIIKYFLHLDRQKQRQRLEKLASSPLPARRPTKADWERHKRYQEWRTAYEEVFDLTDTEWGPWVIVESSNLRYATLKIYEVLITALEKRMGLRSGAVNIRLAQIDIPGITLPEEETEDDDSEDETGLLDEEFVDVQDTTSANPNGVEVQEDANSLPAQNDLDPAS